MIKEWTDSSHCANLDYQRDIEHMYPLQPCLNTTAAYEYNSQNGLEQYYDPFIKLFCVRINNSPNTGEYFLSNMASLDSNDKINTITQDPNNMGFVQTVFSSVNPSDGSNDLTYNIGQKMKSVVLTDGSLLRN